MAERERGGWQTALAQGISSLLPLIEQRRALRRQEDAILAGLGAQQERQLAANARLDQELAALGASSPEAERARLNAAYVSALQRLRPVTAAPALPTASSRYAADARAADQAVQSYGRRFADLMARIEAPRYQRRHERESIARAGVDLEGIRRDAAADDWLTRFRVATRQANPWATLLAALAKAGIEGYAGRRRRRDDGLEEIPRS